MKRLNKLLNIKEGEGKPTSLLFAYFFFFGAALTAGKTARDTYFLNRFDITYLPLMFLIAAIVVAIIAIINYFVSKRLNLIHSLFQTISSTGLIFGVSLILIQINLNGMMIPFLYVWIDVITIVINFQFVIYASMVFNSRQAKRLFGIILCGSPIARIVIGAGIRPFVAQFGSNYLLTLTAGFILCCVMIAWIARPYIRLNSQVQNFQSEKSKNIGSMNSYLKTLALAIGAAAVATVIIEYQFLIFSSHAFPSEEKLASFFGTFYSVTGFVSLFIQFLLTRWILVRFGILSAIRILPIGLGVGALAVLFNPSLFSASIGRGTEQITKFSLNKTSFDLLWVPVSPDQKQRKKLFIDDTIRTSMQGLTGICIFILIKIWPLSYPLLMQVLSLVVLISISIWLMTTSRLKNGYLSALMSAIEKRHLDFKQMRLDTTDSDIVETIKETLNSDEEAKQIFALDLISDLDFSPWSDTLRKFFKGGTSSVQAKILAMTTEHPDILSNDELRITIEEQGPLVRDAMIIAGKRGMKEIIPAMKHILENEQEENAEIRAAAAAAALIMNRGPCDLAKTTLEKFLISEDDRLKSVALRMLRHIPGFLTDTQLREYCISDSIHVCSAALDIAHHRYHVSLIPCIINCLKHAQTRTVAREALEIYPTDDVVDLLSKILLRDETETDLKIEIIRTLKDYPTPQAISVLVQMLKDPSFSIRAKSIDALLKIARQNPLSVSILEQLNIEGRNIAKSIYALYQNMGLIVKGTEGSLLSDLFLREIEQRIPLLIKLLVLPIPEVPIETYINNERYVYGKQADNLLEIFDNFLPGRESGYIIPLLQDVSLERRCRIGQRHFTDLPKELDIELIRLIQSPKEYHCIVGLDYVIGQHRRNVLEQIDWEPFVHNAAHYETLAKHMIRNKEILLGLPKFPQQYFRKPTKELQMLSILEKTIILRGTNLFEGVPGEEIYYVAQVMEEERLEKGAVLFRRGDKGDYLYIIVTGEILIHIGENELNRHVKGEYFGEMALLDDSPRSANASAIEETLLLKINQDNFLDIMMGHKEVRRSIMRMLNERSRRLTNQYTQALP